LFHFCGFFFARPSPSKKQEAAPRNIGARPYSFSFLPSVSFLLQGRKKQETGVGFTDEDRPGRTGRQAGLWIGKNDKRPGFLLLAFLHIAPAVGQDSNSMIT
jgi:hypothetical protein